MVLLFICVEIYTLFFQSESIIILLLVHMLVLSCKRAKNFIVCDSLKRIYITLYQ